MRLARRLIYFMAAFIFCLGALLAFFHRMGLFEVSDIPVEVTGAADASILRQSPGAGTELRERLARRMQRFDRLKIWEIDLGDVKAAILRDEWVKDVRISRAFPNEIRVWVQPKTPVLVLITTEKSTERPSERSSRVAMVPITENGGMLKPLEVEALPDVPLLRGDLFATDAEMRRRAVGFTMNLPDRGALGRRNVSEISWSTEEGWALTLIAPKLEVKLGDERIDLKVMRVAQVVNYLSANQLKGRVIDASFSKKVLVRLRKGP